MASGNVNIQEGGGGGAVSSVFGRTGDVVGIETDYPFFGQISTVTKSLYVDVNRIDSYVEDGTLARPFKTIAAATAIATSGTCIYLQAGTYTENVTLPEGVSLCNTNDTKAVIDGNLTTTNTTQIHFHGIQILSGNVFTINSICAIEDCTCNGSVVINNVMVRAYNFNIISQASGVTALTINGASGHFQNTMSNISSNGDAPAVNQANGKACFVTTQISGSRAANPIFVSINGFCIIYNSKVINSGGGAAIDVQNGATATNPNILANVFATGDIVCGTANTIIEGVQFLSSGVLSGTALLLRPASLIKNDSSVAGATLNLALNNLNPTTEYISFYVDKNGADTNPGTKTKPFLTIQHALNQITAATDSTTTRRVWQVFVNTGTYDESLSVDIGRKKVVLVARGAVSLGTFGSSNWAPSGTTRNITVTCSLTNIDSIRCSFAIISLTRIQAYGTHQAYGHNFRVSGTLNISNSTGGTSGELNLQGVTLFGWDGVATGNADSITAGSWAGNLNLYADNCRFFGLVTGGVVRLQTIKNCSFEKLATVATYSQINNCEIKAGMTWTVAPTEVPPCVISNSSLIGTFTGGASNNLLLDEVSNYFFIANGAAVAGGAVKVLISDSMHLSGTETIAGDKVFNGKFETPKLKITPEGGIAIKLTNKTGAASIKGYVVVTSSSFANAVELAPVDAVYPIGVFYESGIADGQEAWIVVSGLADIYVSDTTTGYFARVCETGDPGAAAGMAYAEPSPSPPLATDSHFREISHLVGQRTGAGLVRGNLHFN